MVGMPPKTLNYQDIPRNHKEKKMERLEQKRMNKLYNEAMIKVPRKDTTKTKGFFSFLY